MSRNGSADISIVYNGCDKWSFEATKKIRATSNHAVLFRLPLPHDGDEALRPHRSPDMWDNYHVRLPHSEMSKYVFIDENGTKTTKRRWELIEQSLLIDFDSSHALERAIKAYNSRYESSWSFASLHHFVNSTLSPLERSSFLKDLLPKIVRLALRLPEIVQCAIPLLKQGENKSISMSQEQAACLLANGFLCTFPRRNATKRDAEFANYPEINFNRLYNSDIQRVNQKLYCILNYFNRVVNDMPRGVLTFTRRSLSFELPSWPTSVRTFSSLLFYVSSDERIENAAGMLQVDFANKFVGGGVLGNGLVQEEIRFLINPELIVSKLFTECLAHEESLLVIGSEQYNSYSGYASTFRYTGNFPDPTPRDTLRRRKCHIVAIDALPYKSNSEQFKEATLLRELNKAYAGFYNENFESRQPVSSGFWGAGAFMGDPVKAALIQFMACRETRRNLAFFTFGDVKMQQTIFHLFELLAERGVSVGRLFQILKQFNPSKSNDLAMFVNERTKQSETQPIKPKIQLKIKESFQSVLKTPFSNNGGNSSSGGCSEAVDKFNRPKLPMSMVEAFFTNHESLPTKSKAENKASQGPTLLDRLDDDFFKS